MHVALIIDFLWLAYRIVAAWNNKSVDFGCELLFALIWYPLTIHIMGGAFPGTSIDEGVELATEQATSLGYGTASVRGNDQKLFHGVNGIA